MGLLNLFVRSQESWRILLKKWFLEFLSTEIEFGGEDMKKVLLAGAAALALSGAAFGDVWVEQGDAGDLIGTAQHTVGSGSLDSISGVHITDDVDLYCIRILDVGRFFATTTGGTSFDTQMWLFDADGYGVSFDDDDPNGGLQSRLTGQFVPGPGIYYLGVSRYNRDAVDGSGALLWNSSPFNVERAPDGPGAGNPLAGWVNTTSAGGEYTIFLGGAGFCEVPAPGALALLGLGGFAAAGRRRRQA